MWFSQRHHRIRLEWGRSGAARAASRGDVVVIVDVLSFSSAVATAVERGGVVVPAVWGEDPKERAARLGVELAVHRQRVPAEGRFSLSPITFLSIEPGMRVMLPSPNGATCSLLAPDVPALFVGSLLNATATARAVSAMMESGDAVTIVACGERWMTPNEDGEMRVAIEDYIGAGAILAAMPIDGMSPEARLCRGAFLSVKDDLERTIWECGSGVELRDKGFPDDVTHASKLDLYSTAAVMMEGEIVAG